jgi:uncharacterized repeat protein (TIGR02543 family)
MKKILFLMLAGSLLAAGTARAQATSGNTGSCTWALTGSGSNLTLTISGNGAMAAYFSIMGTPWFNNDMNIQTVAIRSGVTHIGSYSFYTCFNLQSLTIPASVVSIEDYAFFKCSSLPSVICLGEVPPYIGFSTFENTSKYATLYVMNTAAVTAYTNDFNWNNSFSSIVFRSNYIVTFTPNNGSNSFTQQVISGGKAPEPVLPTKTGYTFAGWYTTNTFTTAWNFATDTVTSDTTLYAKWELDEYAIAYELNGGVNHPGNPTAHTVESATITLTAAEKAGYTLMGWSGAFGAI